MSLRSEKQLKDNLNNLINGLYLIEDNFNGRNSPKPSIDSIEKAKRIIFNLLEYTDTLFPQDIRPDADGGVAIVYCSTEFCYCDILCSNEGDVVYSWNDRKNKFIAKEMTEEDTKKVGYFGLNEIAEFVCFAKYYSNGVFEKK